MKSRGYILFQRIMMGMLQHLVAASILIIFAAILFHSNLTVITMDGQKTFSLDPLSQKGEFEESEVFENLFQTAVNDVIQLAIIREQMEVNGIYWASKKVDVTEFLKLYGDPEKDYGNVTAEFELEELIRWGKYGLEYRDREFSLAEFVNYFGEISTENFDLDSAGNLYFIGKPNTERSDEEAITIANAMIPYTDSQRQDMAFSYIIGKVGEGISVTREDDGELTVHVGIISFKGDRRYKLYDYVDNWIDFIQLQKNIDETCKILSKNYELYQSCNQLYAEGNSNLKYVVRMKADNDYVKTFTNATTFLDADDESITEKFEECRRYLIYYPNSLEIMGNTELDEDMIYRYLRQANYPHPETVFLWIALDNSYESEGDAFYFANEIFTKVIPNISALVAIMILLLLIWIGLGIYLTITDGVHYTEEDEPVVTLNRFDHIWTEILLGAAVLTGYGAYRGFLYLKDIADTFYISRTEQGNQLSNGVLYQYGSYALFGFLLSLLISLLWYSFIRRVICRNLWWDSLVHWIYEGGKALFGMVMQHQNSIVSVLLPYNLFLMVNILGVYGAYHVTNLIGKICLVLLTIAFDTFIGMLMFRNNAERNDVVDGINRIRQGEVAYKLNAQNLHGTNRYLAEAVNNIGDGIENAVNTSIKDEMLKTDLITNVSHDLKTPLTSIINYVDLLKRQNIQQEPARGYIEILESKSQRLKDLTDDLVEASKISSGSIELKLEKLNLSELLLQAVGELSEKFEEAKLKVITDIADTPALIYADSRRMWRIMENLFNNVCKYALEGTRVYAEIQVREDRVFFSVKNVSKAQMNIKAEELTERFIRGDSSRSSEGSGLGLFIAKSLTNAQNGNFNIQLDGDLFKVHIDFPFYHDEAEEVKMPAPSREKKRVNIYSLKDEKKKNPDAAHTGEGGKSAEVAELSDAGAPNPVAGEADAAPGENAEAEAEGVNEKKKENAEVSGKGSRSLEDLDLINLERKSGKDSAKSSPKSNAKRKKRIKK
ncbi:MAG: hypothetical protein J5898_09945 [Lachnospiraceae bacterium]|nr:hypothetical protein [Lachnospiraceae bacterium]